MSITRGSYHGTVCGAYGRIQLQSLNLAKKRPKRRNQGHTDGCDHQTSRIGKTFGMLKPLPSVFTEDNEEVKDVYRIWVRKGSKQQLLIVRPPRPSENYMAHCKAHHKCTLDGPQHSELFVNAPVNARVTKDKDLQPSHIVNCEPQSLRRRHMYEINV